MKRLRRILFNGLTVLSLLLALVSAALWVRSYFARESLSNIQKHYVGGSSEWNYFCVCIGWGQLRIDYRGSHEWGPDAQPASFPSGFRFESERPMLTFMQIDGPAASFDRFGFTLVVDDSGTAETLSKRVKHFDLIVVIPFWVVTIVSGMPAFIVLAASIFQWRHARTGLCPACGYDTRGNPAKCSECGHEITAKAVDHSRHADQAST